MSIQKYTEIFFRDMTSLGSIYIYMICPLIALFTGEYRLFLQLSFGAVASFMIAVIIRLIYFKERPNKQPYGNLIEKIDAASFPSIHAARASFMFLAFGSFFRNNVIITIFLAIIALLICYSRIYLKKHDFADVGGGIFMGLGLGYIVLSLI